MFEIHPVETNLDDIPDLAQIMAIVFTEGREKAEEEYKKTFATWEDKPGLRVVPAGYGAFEMELTGEPGIHWGYIDEGTKTREIHPRPENEDGLLKFQSGFSPKTTSGLVGSQSGGKFGGYTQTPFVKSHSIEARRWTKEIERTVNAYMEQRFVDLVNRPRVAKSLFGKVSGFFRSLFGAR